MNRILIAALLSSTAAVAAPWNIDSGHASANFSVRHMMISDVTGTLGEVKGTIDLDEKDISRSKVEASIDVAGVNTKNQKRDDHLRSPDFFDAAKFPAITFKSTKIEKTGQDKLSITGNLTIRGTTKPVVLQAELTPEVQNPFSKATTRGATATTTINREDFGLTWNMPLANNGLLVGKDVKISLALEFVKQDTKPATK